VAKVKYHRKTATIVLLKKLIKDYLPPYKTLLILAWCFMLLDALMTGTMAKLMEPVINYIFIDQKGSALKWIGFMVMGVFALRGFATYSHGVLMNKVGQGVVAKIQAQLFGHLIKSDLSYHHKTATGKLISHLVNDVNLMRDAVAECLTAVGKNTLTLTFLIIVMFYQDWKLAIGAFLVFPAAGVFVAYMGKKLRNVSANTQEELGYFSSLLSQCFQNIRHIKAYNKENYEISRVTDIIYNIYHLVHKSFRVQQFSQPMGEILSGGAIVMVLVVGGAQVIDGGKTPGALFSFITAFLLAYEPMKRLARLNGRLQAGLAAADRVFAMLEAKPKIKNIPQAPDLVVKKGKITFENVSFTYEESDKGALHHINLEVPAGKTVALVGPSGAGKSTLLNLIPRFYDLETGTITIDGQDISRVKLSTVRDNIALVSQEIALFDDTVFANIAYGVAKKPTRQRVIDAAKSAAAHEFIEKLPEGYNTIIGEHGIKLSGGQRQRLSIARAMLKDAPILLLDEATSALDTESERLVQDALIRLQKGRTTLVIAHRLSTIQDADIIYVLDQGKIKERGTHTELLKSGKRYKRLHGKGLNG